MKLNSETQNKKILIITTDIFGGGLEKFSQFLIEAIRNDYIIKVFLTNVKDKNKTTLYLQKFGVDFTLFTEKGKIKRFIALTKLLRSYNPFAVFCCWYRAGLLFYISNLFTTQRGQFFVLRLANHPIKKDGRLFSLTRSFVFARANFICTNSTNSAVWLKRNFPGSSTKVLTIYNPIIHSQGQFMASVKKYDLVWIGSFSPHKNPVEAIQIFNEFKKRRPGARFLMYGEGQLLVSSKQYAKLCGLECDIDFPGFCDSAFESLQKARCLIHTSSYEGFPNVLLEAVSAGIPIVSWDCEFGPSETIFAKKNGSLIPPGSKETFIEEALQWSTKGTIDSGVQSSILKRHEYSSFKKNIIDLIR
jgi:glycosyltransferase involved in cell wall biosynthesis